MITKNKLSELYNSSLFSEHADSFSLLESDKGAFISGATFNLPGGSFVVCSEKLWSASTELYVKRSQDFYFKRKCDGFVICDYNDKYYLIWIELKSGFNNIFKDAIYQIASCYVKSKSYLHNIKAYHPEEYKELGIVVSEPEDIQIYTPEQNKQIYDRRVQLTTAEETAMDKCRRRYRKKGKIILNGTDFGANGLQLADNIMLQSLPVVSVTSTIPHPSVDLAQIIAAL